MIERLLAEYSVLDLCVYAAVLGAVLAIFIGCVIELGRYLRKGIEERQMRDLPWWDLDH